MAMFIWKLWEHVGFTTQKQSTEQHSCSSCSSAKNRSRNCQHPLAAPHLQVVSMMDGSDNHSNNLGSQHNVSSPCYRAGQVAKTKWENRGKTVGKTMGTTMGHGQTPYFLHFPSLPKSWKTVRCPVLFPETQCYSNQGKDRQEMTRVFPGWEQR